MTSLLPDGLTDPYILLEVARNASAKDIRRAYRKKARDIHPDKNPDDPNAEVNFHLLQAAFEFLDNVDKRKPYDEFLRKEDERRTRFLKQTQEKQEFAKKLEKAEQKTGRPSSVTIVREDHLRKEELRRAREDNEEWLAKHQAKMAKPSSSSVAEKDFPSTESSPQQSTAFLEVTWDPEDSMSSVGVTKASLNLHFNRFGSSIVHSFDPDDGKAMIGFSSRQIAIESALYFLKNKVNYPFSVKFLKNPPSRMSSCSSTVPPPVQPTPSNLADVESDILIRLREAARRQKQGV